MKKIIIISTYLITLMFGFGLGVYFLPIIIAEKSQSIQEIENIKKQATYETEFKRGQRGNDFFHWGEGKVYISNQYISFKGQISPGPDYKIYFLTKEKHRPGQLKNSKPEIRPESEGGMSYWSMRTHRWVLPKLDKQTKKYIPPQKNL